ncbi:MAG: peptidylprolyl isomerase [bacterium]
MIKPILASAIALIMAGAVHAQSQVLVTVGDETVTDGELESAISSSPFSTQFVAMDEDQQASFRGDLLQRLVASRLLTLEARKQGLDKSPEFASDVKAFSDGLLYRFYMDKLRAKITLPDDVLEQMKKDYKGQADALAATKSSYIKDRYRAIRLLTLENLKEQYHVTIHHDRLKGPLEKDSVLLEGDGINITYGDLVGDKYKDEKVNPEWLADKLSQRAELLLIAKAAREQKVDIKDKVASYEAERLPAMLLEKKAEEWVPDEKTLKDYYDAHPGMSKIPVRMHVGQLVTKTKAEAEAFKKRIQAGESLFDLAGKYSIDPYGKSRNGDIGWVREGTGHPDIEKAIIGLDDGALSEVIETPRGFLLMTILERRPGGVRSFAGIRDRVRQAVINDKLVDYINGLGEQYKVVWNVVKDQPKSPTQ